VDDVAVDDVAVDGNAVASPAIIADSEASQDHAPLSKRQSLLNWVSDVLEHRLLPTGGVAKDWIAFERRDPSFAVVGPILLQLRGRDVPDGVPQPAETPDPDQPLDLDLVVPVLDRYIRHHLRRSPHPEDQSHARHLISRLRLLGVQITETGTQACASPVGRVLAYARSKAQAVIPILLQEIQVLGAALRAVIVADYEKTSAVSAEVEHLLDPEAGGAIAAFRAILSNPGTDTLDPILVTGSSVLVDDDLLERFGEAAEQWLVEHGYAVELTYGAESGFHVVEGQGADWTPRVYVEMITELFQRGLTRCLVGTRGLLGEGWDANKINVLVDLTTVTTSMSVNQLRGRSIRLDPDEPEKLADNWDVICVAPEFSKGLDDYRRFRRKHRAIFGVTDDGAIEKGVGHVHAAFTSLKPEELEGSVALLNSDMLQRAARRSEARSLWKIGQPYHPDPVRTVEARPATGGGFPPFSWARTEWTGQSRQSEQTGGFA
ncbi:MAG: DEAD/DEAH box helicase, partial [Planctomycetaceae bacterium]